LEHLGYEVSAADELVRQAKANVVGWPVMNLSIQSASRRGLSLCDKSLALAAQRVSIFKRSSTAHALGCAVWLVLVVGLLVLGTLWAFGADARIIGGLLALVATVVALFGLSRLIHRVRLLVSLEGSRKRRG
jgi:hypothetical protein